MTVQPSDFLDYLREIVTTTWLINPGKTMLAGLLHNLNQIMLETHFLMHLQHLNSLQLTFQQG
ncbi:MAG: hypothetical protein LBV77_03580 [Candidatus Adiutrix intracellularis]|nr:hypothetical protein [Candidatus Adiutrix intracellularis]